MGLWGRDDRNGREGFVGQHRLERSVVSVSGVSRKNSGVNVAWMTIVGLALSNALVALGGGLFSQHQGFADVGSGVGTIIIGLASVMLGEKILPFRGVVSGVLSCLLGSVVYRLFIGFALHSDALGLSTSDLNLVTGLMVMAIMVVSKREVC